MYRLALADAAFGAADDQRADADAAAAIAPGRGDLSLGGGADKLEQAALKGLGQIPGRQMADLTKTDHHGTRERPRAVGGGGCRRKDMCLADLLGIEPEFPPRDQSSAQLAVDL